MKPKPRTITRPSKGDPDPMYALLCDSGVRVGVGVLDYQLLCGVYATRKEAQEVGKEIKDCPAKHNIRKCKVKVTLL